MKIFLSGGLGDVLCLEAHFPPALRAKLTDLYIAARPHKGIVELFSGNPAFPKLDNIEVIWSDFSKFACFLSMRQCVRFMRTQGIKRDLSGVEDWSLRERFSSMAQGEAGHSYTGSSFVKRSTWGEYVAIHARTASVPERRFREQEWNRARELCQRLGIPGYVVGDEVDVPSDFERRDTSTISEAIQLVANSSAFIGVDSCLSVVAGLVLPTCQWHSRTRPLWQWKIGHPR